MENRKVEQKTKKTKEQEMGKTEQNTEKGKRKQEPQEYRRNDS